MTTEELYDIIIIGGGPAGLMAASHCGKKRVLLLEKNSSPGRKLLVSGAGRCNYTHEGSIREFITRYGDHGRFLKHALYQFDNQKSIHFFKVRGLESIADKNGKVFPSTDRASDVLWTLMDACRANGVEFQFEASVSAIATCDEGFMVKTAEQTFHSAAVLIATGGKSYPKTGSSGDGYAWAKSLGHSIIAPKPALTSLLFAHFPYADISGVAIYNRVVSLYRNGKKIREYQGDIGFTHKGLSGPGILDFSRYFEVGDQLKINLCDLQPDLFRERFIVESRNSGKLSLKNHLKSFDIPESLVKLILDRIGIDGATTLATVSKGDRNVIVDHFTGLPFEIEQIAGFSQAMATAGGVNLEEVNPKTMESKLVKNLYFAGEVLDIDGDSGGYNIQAAFSMGVAVAEAIMG